MASALLTPPPLYLTLLEYGVHVPSSGKGSLAESRNHLVGKTTLGSLKGQARKGISSPTDWRESVCRLFPKVLSSP